LSSGEFGSNVSGTVDSGTPSLRGVRDGVGLVGEGISMLVREKRLWALASVPVAFCTLALAGATSAVYVNAAVMFELLTSWFPVFEVTAWYQWLWLGPLKFAVASAGYLLFAGASAVALLVALLLANLASAPFLDALSQRVEAIVTGQVVESDETGLAAILGEARRSMASELQRLCFFVAVWGVISLAGVLIPGAQLLAPPALMAFTAAFLPLDYAGYALDRRQVAFGVRRRWLRENLSIMLGFGTTAMATALIPGLNLLLLPALVVGGTLLALRRPVDALGD
jgi:CysZ protein